MFGLIDLLYLAILALTKPSPMTLTFFTFTFFMAPTSFYLVVYGTLSCWRMHKVTLRH